MKINREMVVRAGLKLLNEVGLEQLTLRRLAVELKVQAATLYWHFESKEALLDEMATSVLADGAPNLVGRRAGDWKQVTAGFGRGLRKTLLGYRDGARMVSGTRLTNTVYMETVEGIGARGDRGGIHAAPGRGVDEHDLQLHGELCDGGAGGLSCAGRAGSGVRPGGAAGSAG